MSEKIDIKTVSTSALAYLGDSTIEVCVRRFLVEEGLSSSRHLNSAALGFVRAPEQAEAMLNIAEHLTEEEAQVYRRGRNLGHSNTPKNCTVAQYRAATGMETLFGYLYLLGETERIDELFRIAFAHRIKEVSEVQNKL
ncbi:MAG: ribonuclease III domain-containing protein [Clostridia bacterium]|nr:ribonuclease III domain-containing protein [Clostridia bacterium]